MIRPEEQVRNQEERNQDVMKLSNKISLKKAGIRDIAAMENMREHVFVALRKYNSELDAIDSNIVLEDREDYLIRLDEKAIGSIGIVIHGDRYEVKEIVLKEEYQEKDTKNTVLEVVKTMFEIESL